MVAGRQRSIVQQDAEVACVDVRDHPASVPACGQELAGELVERTRLGARHLDGPVERCSDDEIGQRSGHVIRCDRLHKGRRQANHVAVDAGLDDAVDELEELRRAGGSCTECRRP